MWQAAQAPVLESRIMPSIRRRPWTTAAVVAAVKSKKMTISDIKGVLRQNCQIHSQAHRPISSVREGFHVERALEQQSAVFARALEQLKPGEFGRMTWPGSCGIPQLAARRSPRTKRK